MKKVLISALVAVSMVAVSSVASAKILKSHHDLSGSNGGSNYKVVGGPSACEYCHAPHNIGRNITGGVDVMRAPLWNRIMPTGFTTYGATVSSDTAAGSGTNATVLGQNSLTCLSCHDGATGLSTLASYNYWGDTSAAGSGNWMSGSTLNIDSALFTMLGKDLKDDHPVGFAFVAERAGVPDSVFTKATQATDTGKNTSAGSIKFFLYDGKFECASCHDPHDTTTGNTGKSGTGGNSPDASKRGGSAFFLRAPIQSICTDCHANK